MEKVLPGGDLVSCRTLTYLFPLACLLGCSLTLHLPRTGASLLKGEDTGAPSDLGNLTNLTQFLLEPGLASRSQECPAGMGRTRAQGKRRRRV